MVKFDLNDIIVDIFYRQPGPESEDYCEVTNKTLNSFLGSLLTRTTSIIEISNGKYKHEEDFSSIPFVDVTSFEEYGDWCEEFRSETACLMKAIKFLKKEMISEEWNYIDKNGINIHKAIAAILVSYKNRYNRLLKARRHYKLFWSVMKC